MMDRIEQVLTEALSPLRLRPAPYYAAKAAYRRRQTDRFRRTRPHASPQWRGVRILAYHRVSDDDDPLSVSARDFEAHLDVIVRNGIETVPLVDAVGRLERVVDERVLCITFDDGYLDNLKVAAPLLARRGLPATVFIASRILDSRAAYYWYGTPPPAMTLDDVRRLIAEGRIDVQPHTLTHPALPRLDDVMARREISACKAELEAMLGRPMTIFSYPAGLHGPREIEMVREADYRAAVTTIAGVNPGGTSPFTLRRTMVPQATDGTQFEALLSGAFDSEPYLIRTLRSRLGGPAPSRP
jgi:peptidoglycan/xylan/chitin deacetylase (PgdA/CDA1 family)